MTMSLETIDKLIANYRSQIDKLEQLRDMFALAEAFEVDVNEILSSGYRAPTRSEHKKWSKEARTRLPYFHTHGPSAATGNGCKRVRNRLKLRDGRELERVEPVFLTGAPTARR